MSITATSATGTTTGVRLHDGVTVVELAHPLTEYAGLVLAGLGATVWLVEEPGGVATRQRRPFAPGVSESRRSIPFLARNQGKKSAVFDPASDDDRAAVGRLLAGADVVIMHEASPFAALALACGRPVVRVTDPRALGTAPVVGFAASGALSSSGWPHQPPCMAPSYLALDAVGTFSAVVASILVRTARHGRAVPKVCDVPYSEAAISGLTSWTRTLFSYQQSTAGQGAESKRLGSGPFPVFPCRDGYVRVIASVPRQWQGFLKLLGEPDALMGEEWTSFQFRNENWDALFMIASEITANETVDALFHKGQEYGLPITPVLDVRGVLDDTHIAARHLFATIDDPEAGQLRVLRAPLRTAEPGDGVALSPAPALGQHDAEARAVSLRVAPRAGTGGSALAPLAGLRVLSFGVGAVVPEATSVLALLGAEVIKVESMNGLDFFRALGLDSGVGINGTPTFNQANLGVRSVTIDMSCDEGRRIGHQLVATADMIMENMRGTVMRKWGLDFESVRAINPSIIYMSAQGLGDGPYGAYTTYGPNLQSFAGMTTVWAHPDDPYPVGSTLAYPDQLAGRQALAAVMAALARRDRTGKGCYLDCAQFETATWAIADKFVQEQLLPGSVQAMGNRSLDMAPHGCYPCAGNDKWVALAVEDDEQWAAFGEALGEPWTRDPRFATTGGRLEAHEELDRLVAGWTHERTPTEVESCLRARGLPVSRLLDGASQSVDAELHASGFYVALPHPTLGVRWYTGVPFTFDGRRPPARRAPMLGEHCDHVFFDVLGLDPVEASRLVEAGAIGT